MNAGSHGIESILSQMDASAAGSGGGYSEGSGNGNSGIAGVYNNSVYNGGGTGGTGSGYLMEMQRVVEQKFDASLKNPEEDPQQAYVELAKMLRNVRPGFVASNLMPGPAQNSEPTQEEVTRKYLKTRLCAGRCEGWWALRLEKKPLWWRKKFFVC